ncbi:hypothetical protein B0J12DRAFT_313490 [Macrophomina phaseolina]|uniref:Uncharacterized protein n=1 Tax=Macrophomina phaseolina TaxID=35725 RepID=A0ABQ8FWG2_9PEZI|nr:hypothetical protein B0J12DRAFT_313490 [Macrophomina phaseolina]
MPAARLSRGPRASLKTFTLIIHPLPPVGIELSRLPHDHRYGYESGYPLGSFERQCGSLAAIRRSCCSAKRGQWPLATKPARYFPAGCASITVVCTQSIQRCVVCCVIYQFRGLEPRCKRRISYSFENAFKWLHFVYAICFRSSSTIIHTS